ncbi:MAG: hypothetical protein ACNA7K_03240 [Acholeplasmataceae bacterium]
MRKTALLTSLLFILLLSACTIDINVNDQSYDANAYQIYHQYLEHDIITADQFIDVVNGFTYEVVPSVVHIKMDLRHLITFDRIQSFEGNGIIIEQTLNRVIVLTSSVFANTDETLFADYDLFDYKNEHKEATLLYHLEDMGLALLQFTKPSGVTYPTITVAQYQSTPNEPLFILGRHQNIVNGMTMGFITDIFEEVDQLSIHSELTEYGLGDTIFSLKKTLIGIHIYVESSTENPVFVNYKHIQRFLELYRESLEDA